MLQYIDLIDSRTLFWLLVGSRAVVKTVILSSLA